MNNYVDFANETIKAFAGRTHFLTQSNRLLTEHYTGQISEIRYKSSSLDIEANAAKVLSMKTKTLEEGDYLLDRFRMPLDSSIQAIHALYLRSNEIYRFLDGNLSANQFSTKGMKDSAFDSLRILEILYKSLKKERDILVERLRYVYKQYRIKVVGKELNQVYDIMDAWHVRSDELLEKHAQESHKNLLEMKDVLASLNKKLSVLTVAKKGALDNMLMGHLIPIADSLIYFQNDYLKETSTYLNTYSESNVDSKCNRPQRAVNRNYSDRAQKSALGITHYSNMMIDQSGENYLKFVENTPVFEPIDPREFKPKAPLPPMVAKKEEHQPVLVSSSPPIKVEKKKIDPKDPFAFAAPNHLVLLLDISSSMQARSKLPLLKSTLKEILPKMRPEDKLSIVTYAGDAEIELKGTSVEGNMEAILAILDKIGQGITTNVEKGIVLSYKQAHLHFIPGGNNQIILCTDGLFMLKEDTYALVSKKAELRDIKFSVFYFDEREQIHTKNQLTKLSTTGKGHYYFIKQDNVATKLIERLTAVVE